MRTGWMTAAWLGLATALPAAADPQTDAKIEALEAQIESESSALYATGRVWDDGIIHPADSRTVLGLGAMLLGVIVFIVLSIYPATPRPKADQLSSVELAELAGSTELWLEARRRSLPSAAIDAIDMIGVRLEQLAPQLVTLDENGPAAREVRKLLSEHLPGLVDSYTRIPPALRGKEHAGSTPSEQLVDGLCVIAEEIEAMSHDLSRNDLDALATRGRFLEAKYIDHD